MKSSGNHRPIDRALGAAATLSLSFVILRLVAQALKAAKRDGQESLSFRIFQEILRGLFRTQEKVADYPSETVLHAGSCHCQAVTFEVGSMTRFITVLIYL